MLSFAEFAERVDLKRLLRRAFEAHVRDDGGFNFRTEREWQRLLSEYRTADRRRRT